MFKVGEFARLSQTSVKTLHHYDEIGLLRPVRVDDTTGYRYYAAEQLPQLVHILTLKDLGFSLDQIGALLQANLPREQVAALLRLKKIELTERIHQEQERLERVSRRLAEMEHSGVAGHDEIQIKHVEALTVAAVQRTTANIDSEGIVALIQEGFELLYAKLYRGNARISGGSLLCWQEGASPDELGDLWMCVPIAGELPAVAQEAGVFLTLLPAVETMASVLHQGSVLDRASTFVALFTWLKRHSYQIVGTRRDLILQYAGSAQESSVIEFQFPVRRSVPEKESD